MDNLIFICEAIQLRARIADFTDAEKRWIKLPPTVPKNYDLLDMPLFSHCIRFYLKYIEKHAPMEINLSAGFVFLLFCFVFKCSWCLDLFALTRLYALV